MAVVDSSPDVLKLAWELDEEEKELWMQLRRKRDFESRVAEKRSQLQDLRDRRRRVSVQQSEAAASVEHLSSEVEFAHDQVREVQNDIEELTESNRILQQAWAQQHAGVQYSSSGGLDPNAILAEEKSRQDSIQLQHEQISHLRAHLNKLRAEKADLLRRQQFMFEKQRSAEQDRNRLLGTLQDDRSHINEVRQERIRLWEERSRMEQEMAQLVHDANLRANGTNGNREEGTGRSGIEVPDAFSRSARGQAPTVTFGGGGYPSGNFAAGAASPGSFASGAYNVRGDVGTPGAGQTEWADKLRHFGTGSPNGRGGF